MWIYANGRLSDATLVSINHISCISVIIIFLLSNFILKVLAQRSKFLGIRVSVCFKRKLWKTFILPGVVLNVITSLSLPFLMYKKNFFSGSLIWPFFKASYKKVDYFLKKRKECETCAQNKLHPTAGQRPDRIFVLDITREMRK